MRCERGVATVEWTALILLVSVFLGALAAVGPRVDGRAFGAFVAHSIVCAVRGGCDDGDGELRAAYGAREAALVREYAPNLVYEPSTLTLPIDFRDCRAHTCSDAPDDADLDAHRSARGGGRATAFTRLVREGDETFIQYWLYYPDSTTTALNAAGGWNTVRRGHGAIGIRDRPYPGYHGDDWESYQVRIGAQGRAMVRASSHGGYQGCKHHECKNRWTPWTGWTRVSFGSHAGHIPLRREWGDSRRWLESPLRRTPFRYRPLLPGRDVRERTTTAPGLRLVPLETIDPGSYRPLDPTVTPPWRKRVFRDPRSVSTG
jgi:hypothetical protein